MEIINRINTFELDLNTIFSLSIGYEGLKYFALCLTGMIIGPILIKYIPIILGYIILLSIFWPIFLFQWLGIESEGIKINEKKKKKKKNKNKNKKKRRRN